MSLTEPCKFCGDETEPRDYFGTAVFVCSSCYRDLAKMTGS